MARAISYPSGLATAIEMTYFLLSITNRCNRTCSYCIVREYVNNSVKYPEKLTLACLVKYFDARASASDAVEITGGEPTLLEWTENFVRYLHSRKILAIMRTNGFRLFRNIYDNLAIVFNPHDESEEYIEARKPLLGKQDLIIHPKIVSNQKPVFETDETSPLKKHGFKQMRFITADGNIRTMSCTKGSIGNVFDISDSAYCVACPHCPFMLGAWNIAQRINFSEG